MILRGRDRPSDIAGGGADQVILRGGRGTDQVILQARDGSNCQKLNCARSEQCRAKCYNDDVRESRKICFYQRLFKTKKIAQKPLFYPLSPPNIPPPPPIPSPLPHTPSKNTHTYRNFSIKSPGWLIVCKHFRGGGAY